jgi:hypothetical protein
MYRGECQYNISIYLHRTRSFPNTPVDAFYYCNAELIVKNLPTPMSLRSPDAFLAILHNKAAAIMAAWEEGRDC